MNPGFCLSRSLLAFLIFCALLVLGSAGLVWYMGPTLAGIVIDDSRRENPYYLLQLWSEAALAIDDGDPSYRARLNALAREEQGQVLWSGGRADVHAGSLLLDVASAQVMEFESGADLVQLLTSSAYRALRAGFGDLTVNYLGTATAPPGLSGDLTTVLVLFRAGDEQPPAALGVPGESGWLALVPRYQGRLRWRTAVDSIRGEESWNRLLVLQFPDRTGALSWLQDPATVTERALAARHVDDMTVLVVQPKTPARWNNRTVPNSSNSPRLGKVRASISPSGR